MSTLSILVADDEGRRRVARALSILADTMTDRFLRKTFSWFFGGGAQNNYNLSKSADDFEGRRVAFRFKKI